MTHVAQGVHRRRPSRGSQGHPDPWWLRIAIWLAGLARLVLVALVLWVVTQPWRELGGLVPELARWLGRVLVTCTFVLAFVASRLVRSAPFFWTRRLVLRRLLWPALGAGAAALAGCRLLSSAESVSLVVTALAAWWGGIESATGAVPMMERACPPPRDETDEGLSDWRR